MSGEPPRLAAFYRAIGQTPKADEVEARFRRVVTQPYAFATTDQAVPKTDVVSASDVEA